MTNLIPLLPPSQAQTEVQREQIAIHNAELISTQTTRRFFKQWLGNMKENLTRCVVEPDVFDLPKGKGTPALVIGNGPSLRKFGHLSLLAESKFKGAIFCTDSAFREARRNGNPCDYVVNLDGDEKALDFFKSIPSENTTLILPCVANPKLRGLWEGGAAWFIDNIGLCKHPCDVGEALSLLSGKSIISTGGNVGTFTVMLTHALGYNPIGLIGMDMSYDINAPLEESQYWNPIYESLGPQSKDIFYKGVNPYWKNEYYSDYMFEVYRYLLLERIGLLRMNVVNCSGQGSLHSANRLLTCMNFNEFLKKYI